MGTIRFHPKPQADAIFLLTHDKCEGMLHSLCPFLIPQKADLASKQPQSLDSLVEYCEKSSSSLLYLTLQILGVNSTAADHAASHLGRLGETFLCLSFREGSGNCDNFACDSVSHSNERNLHSDRYVDQGISVHLLSLFSSHLIF